MGEFFGKPEFNTPEGAYSWQHMLHVSISLAIAIVLAIILGRKNRNKDLATKNKVLIWTALLMHTVETFRIAVGIGASSDGMSWLWELPFFLCSMQFITIPIAALCKGKLKEAALDYVFVFGFLSCTFGTFTAVHFYNTYPVLSYYNICSNITHTASGFAALYIVISGMQSMKKKTMYWVMGILLAVCAVALVINATGNYNYMFLKRDDGTPYFLYYNLVNGNPVLYPMLVIGTFLVYIVLFYAVYHAIAKKIAQRKSKVKTTEIATEIPNQTIEK